MISGMFGQNRQVQVCISFLGIISLLAFPKNSEVVSKNDFYDQMFFSASSGSSRDYQMLYNPNTIKKCSNLKLNL